MIKKFIYACGVACAALSVASCSKMNVAAAPGEEVQFGLATSNAFQTRTLYGADADDESSVKIKWVDGDRMMIFGTTCMEESNPSEYAVNVGGSDYSGYITKAGAIGLRWGEKATSDFVAIYPSRGAVFSMEGGVVTAKSLISSAQNYLFDNEISDGVWKGTHYGSDITTPSMENAVMYACTYGVSPGKDISLAFKPANTALRLRFMGFSSNIPETKDGIVIESVAITAPDGYQIAGDFNISVPSTKKEYDQNSIKASTIQNSETGNSITVSTRKSANSYLKVYGGQAVEFSVFMAPLSGQEVSVKNPWLVSIKIEGRPEPLQYHLRPKEASSVFELIPGYIHRVKIPMLEELTGSETTIYDAFIGLDSDDSELN